MNENCCAAPRIIHEHNRPTKTRRRINFIRSVSRGFARFIDNSGDPAGADKIAGIKGRNIDAKLTRGIKESEMERGRERGTTEGRRGEGREGIEGRRRER